MIFELVVHNAASGEWFVQASYGDNVMLYTHHESFSIAIVNMIVQLIIVYHRIGIKSITLLKED